MKQRITSSSIQEFGPSGIFEQADMNNFKQCNASGLSLTGRRVLQPLSMGMGHEDHRDSLVGTLFNFRITETGQRRLYSRW